MLYIKGENEGNTPAQTSRKDISCWIGASLSDAGNITPLGAINDAPWTTMRQ